MLKEMWQEPEFKEKKQLYYWIENRCITEDSPCNPRAKAPKALFGSLEGRGRKGFGLEGWKYRGKW